MLVLVSKVSIQQAYRAVLAGKGVQARYGQRLMIAEIARYLGEITEHDGLRTSPARTCVLEAGTGTGKTLAYLLAAIPVARKLGKNLVLSTATIALQDQIVHKDLPDLKAHSDLKFTWALAKGRGRYLCLSRLESRLHAEGASDSESLPLFMMDGPAADVAETRAFYEQLFADYAARKWDGDRDHWPEQIPDEIWRNVTTDHRQCTNRHCSYFDSCAFFAARGELEEAEIIVANHDLVMADLALGGGAILPKPEETIYLFDEAHHLPDKALGHFAASVSLEATRLWLKQMSQSLAKLLPYLSPSTQAAQQVERISGMGREMDPQLAALKDQLMAETRWEKGDNQDASQFRYPQGRIPLEQQAVINELLLQSAQMTRYLGALADELQGGLDERKVGEIDRETAEAWYPLVGGLHARSEDQLALWRAFIKGEDGDQDAESVAQTHKENPAPARWLVQRNSEQGEELTLFSSPVLANNVLYSRLWSRCFGAILTSATLSALGRFDRLQLRAGLPQDSRCLIIPPAFRYHDMATLEVPAMPVEPTDSENFAQALVDKLPQLWADGKATLVLFTARRQMHRIRESLPKAEQDKVITQDDYTRSEVLERHRARVDQGIPSVLFGVASFAEGIDLPGDYLQHVVITRLPFSVPDDPIEASLAEWISARGGNPFMEISVPDASIRLVQATGRLLRNEADRGRITILDRRIVSKRYGPLLLDALPPFRRLITP
ncbi:MAG: ATP-dependent DNA helicase DinG [Halomonadaceae bacterium]|nr:MAG: ATP-dependent DNA helicase DinG [Halomonadaceae bacterium]